MLRLNKLTDYAIVVLAQMSEEPTVRHTPAYLAGLTAVPEPTVAKVLKDLVKSGFVTSARGVQGGYTLNKQVDQISVRAVIEAMEGPIAMVECVDPASVCCTGEKKCPLRGRWDVVNSAIVEKLDKITLRDMMAPKKLVQIALTAAE